MTITKISQTIKNTLETLVKKYPLVQQIVKKVDEQGFATLLVGGAVRDLLLGLPVKDLDIEVHGLTPEQLEATLKEFGPVSLVGKAFGVFRVHGLDVDWSLPRSDKPGRKPDVTIDPHMGFEDAFRRRDLTVNAMGIDLVSYELIDPFNGKQDLEQKVLRAPDPAFFVEDPLRFYRVMQFVGRFEMMPDDELNNLCKAMDLSDVSRERIEQEFQKLLLRSRRPSLGITWLDNLGRLAELLPELAAIKGVEQSPQWHPEGEVFEHTMQTIDAAAALEYGSDKEKLIVMYAALCHDLGKVSTTAKNDEGEITSLGHAKESEKLTKQLLKRITNNKDLIDAVCKLVRYHMHPVQLIRGEAKSSAYKRLANKLAPSTLRMLAKVSLADKRGRNPKGHEPLTIDDPEVAEFLKKSEELQVLESREEPVLLGRDLLDEVEAGPQLGELVRKAYEIQIEEGIKDKEELKRRVLSEK